MAEVTKAFPAAPLLRVLKDVLPAGTQVNKSGKEAIATAASIFALRLGTIAGDICSESKRSTVNANDVLRALEELELPQFSGIMKMKLQAFRDVQAAKRKRTKLTGAEQGYDSATAADTIQQQQHHTQQQQNDENDENDENGAKDGSARSSNDAREEEENKDEGDNDDREVETNVEQKENGAGGGGGNGGGSQQQHPSVTTTSSVMMTTDETMGATGGKEVMEEGLGADG